MLENTIENKMRFHALYWGQQVSVFNDEGQYKKGVTYPVDGSVDEATFVVLRPLSAITDEDAIEVAKIHYNRTDFKYQEQDDAIEMVKETINNTSTHLTAADFLRSRGYLLPFCGLPVEKIVEYGWVKVE